MDDEHDITSKLWQCLESCNKDPDEKINQICQLLLSAGLLRKSFDNIMKTFFRDGFVNNIATFLCGWHLRRSHMCLTGPTVDKCDIVDIEDANNGKMYSMKEINILLTVAVCGKANRYLNLEATETPGVFRIEVQCATEWPKSLIKCLMVKSADKNALYLLPMKLIDYIEHLLVENFNKERVTLQPRSKECSVLVFKLEVNNYKFILLNVTPCIETDLVTRDCDRITYVSAVQKQSLITAPLKLIVITSTTSEISYRVAERNLMAFMKDEDRNLLRKLRYFKEIACCQNQVLSFDNFKHCLWHVMSINENWTSFDQEAKLNLILERMKQCVQDGYLPNVFAGVYNLLRGYHKEELHASFVTLDECKSVDTILNLNCSDLLSASSLQKHGLESNEDQFINLYQRDLELNEMSNSLKNLLEIGAELKINVNQASPLTCLKRAIVCNQINDARLLAAHVDHECLLLAAERGNHDILKILISHEAAAIAFQYEEEHEDKETVLHCASRGGHMEVLHLLLEMNLIPDPQHPRLSTPLSVAAAAGRLEVCKALLSYGANPDAPAFGLKKLSLFTVACRDGQTNLVRLLLKYNPLVDQGLHLAAKYGHANCVKEILASGISPNVLDKSGMTPLHRAAERGHVTVARKLLVFGAKLEYARESDNVRPLTCAVKKNHRHMVEFLLSRGASTYGEPNPLLLAASLGYASICETLLRHGSNANYQRHDDGRNALHLAAVGGHLAVAEVLLRWSVKLKVCDKEGLTAKQLVKPCHMELRKLIKNAVEEQEKILAEQANEVARNRFKGAVKVVQYISTSKENI